jgi:hypothetical protein
MRWTPTGDCACCAAGQLASERVPVRRGDQIAATFSWASAPAARQAAPHNEPSGMARIGHAIEDCSPYRQSDPDTHGSQVRTGQQGECVGMARPHDSEMPVIQRRDLGELEPLRDGDHRGIDDTQRQVQVCLDQVGHPLDVLVLQLSHMEAIVTERSEERDFCMRSHPRLQQVSDLTQDRRGYQQRSFGEAQKPDAAYAWSLTLPAASSTPVSHSSMSVAEFGAEDLLGSLGKILVGLKCGSGRSGVMPAPSSRPGEACTPGSRVPSGNVVRLSGDRSASQSSQPWDARAPRVRANDPSTVANRPSSSGLTATSSG